MEGPSTQVWNVSEESFPQAAAIETQLRFLLRFAILAPSPRNSQPWAFAIRQNQVHLMADLARSQPVSDPERRELYIGLGCALENLLVAAEHFGFAHAVCYSPQPSQPGLAATVLFRPGGKRSPERAGATLRAIVSRRNDRSEFRSTPVSDEACRTLRSCLVEPDLELDLTENDLFRQWIHALTLESDLIDFANPAFRLELGYWMTQEVFLGRQALEARGAPPAAWGRAAALENRARAESAALLGLIRANGDSHYAHVRAGQLFERVWLTATTLGLSINPMSQTMRRPEVRATVAELTMQPGWTPQHLFRVGYSFGDQEARTPRRPVEEVLL